MRRVEGESKGSEGSGMERGGKEKSGEGKLRDCEEVVDCEQRGV